MKYIKLYEQTAPEHRVHRRSDGSVSLEAWWLNDKRHREDGPARIWYRPDGSVESEGWYWHGEKAEDITSLEDFKAWQYLKSVGLV